MPEDEPGVLPSGRDLALHVRGPGFHPQHHKPNKTCKSLTEMFAVRKMLNRRDTSCVYMQKCLEGCLLKCNMVSNLQEEGRGEMALVFIS